MSEKKITANAGVNDGPDHPVLFSPPTFSRHASAVDRIESRIRTRVPRPGNNRSPGLAPGAWGLLASGDTITAASGTTLGTGHVKLCDKDGTVYPENESVDVLNAAEAITASGGPKILGMEWVLGDWSVCGGTPPTTPSCFTGCGCINVGQTIQISDSTLGLAVDIVYSSSTSSNPWGRAKSWGGRASYAFPGGGGCDAKTIPIFYNLDAVTCKMSVGWYAEVGGTECPTDDTSNPANFVSFDVPNELIIFSSCDPFERYSDFFDWTAGPSSDSSAWNNLYNFSQTSLTVTSPYSTTKCCVRFVINGCNALGLPNATVKVWTNSSKTTLIGQGVTDSTGSVIMDVHSHGSIYYEASSDRFVTGTRTVTVSVCGNSVGVLTLLPASGFHCIIGTNCVYPFKDTMFATDRYGNATTVVFDGTGTAGWKGTSPTFNYPGCGGCAAVPGYSYGILLEQLGGDLQLDWVRAGASGPPASCPGTVTAVGFQGTSNNNFICPPVGAMYFHVANPADTDTNNLFCSTLGDHDFIITE